MNSSAANVNWSALLNLGGQQRAEQQPQRPKEKDQSFDKHLADESSKARAHSKTEASSHASEPRQESRSVTDTKAESKSKGDQMDAQAESTPREAGEEHAESSSASTVDSASDEVVVEEQTSATSEVQGDVVQAVGSDLPTEENPQALVADSANGDEVVIDVPKQSSVSLENVANAATAVAEDPEVNDAAIRSVVDQLVDGLPPEAKTAGAAGGSPAAVANTSATVDTLRPAAQVVSPAQAAAGESGAESLELDVEGGLLSDTPKSVSPRTVDLQQVADSAPRPNQQTLNQQLATHAANAANAAEAVMKDAQGGKADSQGGGQRDAQAAIVAAQRAAARPVTVQQGNAQFTMPPQAKPGQPQWQTAVSERVAVMASQRITSAEIQLDPPELGQLQVRVTLNQEQASVSFASQHAVVREALDQTAHKLREMFDGEGLDLVDVDVSDQSFEQQREQQENESGGWTGGVEGQPDAPTEVAVKTVSQGLVDHFV